MNRFLPIPFLGQMTTFQLYSVIASKLFLSYLHCFPRKTERIHMPKGRDPPEPEGSPEGHLGGGGSVGGEWAGFRMPPRLIHAHLLLQCPPHTRFSVQRVC